MTTEPDTNPTSKKARVGEWVPVFIAELGERGNVRAACKAAGIHRSTAYERRDADTLVGKDFAKVWDDALANAVDLLDEEARRRAMGIEQTFRAKNGDPYIVTTYSDTLLIFLLKAHGGSKYKDTMRQEHTGKDGGPIILRVVYDDGD